MTQPFITYHLGTDPSTRSLFGDDAHSAASTSWDGPFCPPNRKAYRSRIAYLCMRILLGHHALHIDLSRESAVHRDIADLVGVPEFGQKSIAEDVIRGALAARHSSGALYPAQGGMPDAEDCPLKRNMEWIIQTAQLSETEARVFEMAVLIRAFPALGSLFGETEPRSAGDHYYLMASLFDLDPLLVKDALRRDSVLMRCALVNFWHHGLASFSSFLKAPHGLTDNLEHHTEAPDTLLRSFIVPLQQASLGLHDFDYMERHNQLATAWLSGALESSRLQHKGGHMLVYGAPGLGKTEWVRSLLHQAGVNAMELAVFAETGVALTGVERLRNLRMSMYFMQHTSRGVLVFDEADDVFGGRHHEVEEKGVDSATVARNHRASLSHTLETSRLPVIWIMNEPDVLDPAVVRRFDAVIQFEPMPRNTRYALICAHFGETSPQPIADKELQSWAHVEGFTPALIASLARMRERAHQAGEVMDASILREWIQQRVKERGGKSLRRKVVDDIPWSPTMVNASMDLSDLMEGIQKHPHARVLLYGLPGTGKTAYAKALALSLRKPLMERRASDLLSAFVGETEVQIAAAFEHAAKEEAVLFLDEADSLLASKESASKNWEVTQVNELLVQLNDFPGVVILATNWLAHLDTALLRRMDAKVEFLPLYPEQSDALLRYLTLELGIPASSDGPSITSEHRARLHRLHPLTPGDFALVRRRIRFAPLISQDPINQVHEIVDLLEDEMRHKSLGKRPMGFMHLTSVRDVNATARTFQP
jgi:transitional endoplasmic reticulum ATPase